MIKNKSIHYVINTTDDKSTIHDSYIIRQSAIQKQVCYSTTVAGGLAVSLALSQPKNKATSLQEWHVILNQTRQMA